MLKDCFKCSAGSLVALSSISVLLSCTSPQVSKNNKVENILRYAPDYLNFSPECVHPVPDKPSDGEFNGYKYWVISMNDAVNYGHLKTHYDIAVKPGGYDCTIRFTTSVMADEVEEKLSKGFYLGPFSRIDVFIDYVPEIDETGKIDVPPKTEVEGVYDALNEFCEKETANSGENKYNECTRNSIDFMADNTVTVFLTVPYNNNYETYGVVIANDKVLRVIE